MSVIVAIKKDGVVYMGADSCETIGKGIAKCNDAVGSNAKICKRPDGMLVGSVGVVKSIRACITDDSLFEFDEGEQLTKKWIVNKFIPRLKKSMGAKNLLDDDGFLDIGLILAKGDALYKLTSGYVVYKVDNFAVAGSGGAAAMAYVSDDDQEVEDRILSALRIASKFDAYVGAPYVLYDTKNLEYKEVVA